MTPVCERCGREDVGSYTGGNGDNVEYVDLTVGAWRRIRYLCVPCGKKLATLIDDWLTRGDSPNP